MTLVTEFTGLLVAHSKKKPDSEMKCKIKYVFLLETHNGEFFGSAV